MAASRSFNAKVIDEFRANGGEVGGPFEGEPLLLLTTTGRRSGTQRTTPVMYQRDADRVFVFASYAGADEDPAWFRNLEADPAVHVEIGDEAYDARAAVLDGAERDAVWERQVELIPRFAEYQAATSRVIPVIELVRG